MAGTGKRFLDAGYTAPKPLIEVDGRTVIEHIVNLFPGESKISFICNSQHMKETNIVEILKNTAPTCKIYEIPPHKKGPVYTVSFIFDRIDDNDEVIINYCDFSKHWDYKEFLNFIRSRHSDGAISAYRGFHPHMMGATNYAFIREENLQMLEIKEKEPFTNNRMEEYASDGTYYFKKGLYVKKYFKQLMEEELNINGEYYISMVYNLMRRDLLNISIYEIQHMLQWGTPRDLEEYQRWSDYFRKIITPCQNIRPQNNSINLIPLAGAGSRFAKEGYKDPKPLIRVNNKPMVIQAANSLPLSEKNIFICRSEHLNNYPLKQEIRKVYPQAKVVAIDRLTEGQACTCEIGLKDENLESPLLIGACDNGMLWDKDKYTEYLNSNDVDAIVWSFRRYPQTERNPQMYGWIKVADNDYVSGVSVKKPVSEDPLKDHAIVGTFYFKKAGYFIESLKRLYARNIRVNNEFYVDSCVNEMVEMGLKVKVFEVDYYIGWGTPDELRTYEYWQSFFHKCSWHPYSIERDITAG
ncbi:MAG: NTP transferase domain-containing protein [Nitrospirae bacterium]|nr:NTP transferase domain-containing protein [Nitrospirota bacterium]